MNIYDNPNQNETTQTSQLQFEITNNKIKNNLYELLALSTFFFYSRKKYEYYLL